MRAVALLLVVSSLAAGCKKSDDADSAKPAAPTGKYAAVQTILGTNCAKCHGAAQPKAGINLTSYESLMAGGMRGPVVVPGDPANSLIVKALHGQGARQMPPRSSIPAGDIATIEAWIKDGAKNG